jgi:hypothetical protein
MANLKVSIKNGANKLECLCNVNFLTNIILWLLVKNYLAYYFKLYMKPKMNKLECLSVSDTLQP